MEKNREIIEDTVKKCIVRLGKPVPDDKIQALVTRLMGMKDMKTVVDSLALSIDNLMDEEKDKEQYVASMQGLLELSQGEYKSTDEIIAQVQDNKAKNYTPRKNVNRRKS